MSAAESAPPSSPPASANKEANLSAASEAPAEAPAVKKEPLGASIIVKLVHLDGTKSGRTDTVDFRPLPDQRLTMGRDPSCILAFDPYKDPRVSAHHADVFISGDSLFIEDKGSTNGTRVNGLKIFERTRLRTGDEIELGRKGSRFRIEYDAANFAGSADPNAENKKPDAGDGVKREAPGDESSAVFVSPSDRGTGAAGPKKDPNVLKRGDLHVPVSERAPVVDPKHDATNKKKDGDRIDLGGGHDVGQKTLRLIWRDAQELVKKEGGGNVALLREVVKQSARESQSSLYIILGVLTFFFLVIIAGLVVLILILYNELQDQKRRTSEELAQHNERIQDQERQLGAVRDSQNMFFGSQEAVQEQIRQSRESMHKDLQAIENRINSFRTEHRETSERFQEVYERFKNSVYLIVSRVTLIDAQGREFVCQSSGSGFIASRQGHLVTNKHVVHPWKFGTAAARMRRDNLRIKEGSREVFAWPTGSQVLTVSGDLLAGTAKSLSAGTLVELTDLFPPDRNVPQTFEEFGQQLVHATNDNSDLAVLLLRDGQFDPIPLFERGMTTQRGWQPGPGTAVMALGFPQGTSLFETNIANASLSLGWVRKIEDTIHISAPIIKGNSGGPVLALNPETGEAVVIAVATRVVSGTEAFGICIQIEHALNLLRRQR